MIRALLFWLCLLPATANAERVVYLVELAVFSCPQCRAVDGHSAEIERVTKGRYVFAPLPGNDTAALERAWYVLRDTTAARRVRQRLFEMVHSMRVEQPTTGEVVDWLSMNFPDIDDEDLTAKMLSADTTASLRRAIRLLELGEIGTVPAFVAVADGKVVGTLEKGARPADVFVKDGLAMYRQLTGEQK